MQKLAVDLGPLKPDNTQLLFGVVLFALLYLVLAKVLLPRIARTIAARDDAIHGQQERAEDLRVQAEEIHADYQAALADARHEASRIRQQAKEEGAAAIAEARAEGIREKEAIVAEGTVVIEAERTAAEAELRTHVEELAVELAERILGEPVRQRSVD
ncbi:ATP synthase F0 subunit B [Streptomyces sp. NBC_01465]|uniref:ATP synthase F0 subunit B n=1 Tax=Streptomyces sp. NBC_01465 TaxID=2903878 RepID=UPI002E33F9C2|nr:ATP synthase F0 subunit B [Streptomyces sp. NBC_01465]